MLFASFITYRQVRFLQIATRNTFYKDAKNYKDVKVTNQKSEYT